jgi:hypothetical protein
MRGRRPVGTVSHFISVYSVFQLLTFAAEIDGEGAGCSRAVVTVVTCALGPGSAAGAAARLKDGRSFVSRRELGTLRERIGQLTETVAAGVALPRLRPAGGIVRQDEYWTVVSKHGERSGFSWVFTPQF